MLHDEVLLFVSGHDLLPEEPRPELLERDGFIVVVIEFHEEHLDDRRVDFGLERADKPLELLGVHLLGLVEIEVPEDAVHVHALFLDELDKVLEKDAGVSLLLYAFAEFPE